MSPQRTLLARKSRRSHLDEQFNQMSEKLHDQDKCNKNSTGGNEQKELDIFKNSFYNNKLG